jgi:cyclopropane fatty-acyl-phospholipid synthase-like methyltransferase
MINLDWTYIVPLISYIGLLFCVWIIWPIIIGAIYVPTPNNIVGKMLEMAEVKEGDILYDLGSGDGRIIIEAADKYKAKAIGIEADPLRVLWSRNKIRSRELHDRIKVIWGNFFKSDLSEATVVTVYQHQGINRKLIGKLEEELEPGARVISYSFTFDGWEPIKKGTDSQIFLYKILDKSLSSIARAKMKIGLES